MEVKENKMGTMREDKLLLQISLPIMISMLVQALYNIVDSIFVAQLSEDALTAVSLAFPIQTLMIAISAGTGVGVNALVSRALGEKNHEKASEVARNGIFIYFLSYIVVAIGGGLLVRPFYGMQTDASQAIILEYGVEYLSICVLFSFGQFMQILFERLLQATGRSIQTMISQSTGAIINIVLDPILIFGLFGAPQFGIRGAAMATVIGQIFSGFLCLFLNLRYNKELSLKFRGFRPNGGIILQIYQIGIPSIIMQSIGSVMTTGMNFILMGLSSTAAAVFGVYFKLQSFFFMPIFGLNNGLIPIISYNFGARKRTRMMNTLKYGYMIAAVFTIIGFLCFELFPERLLMLFDASESMLEIGIPALRSIGFHFLAAWFCIVTGSFFQAVGRASYSMYVSVARQLIVLLPVAYILSRIGGVSLIWWSFPIAELMSVVISVICFQLTKKSLLDMVESKNGIE